MEAEAEDMYSGEEGSSERSSLIEQTTTTSTYSYYISDRWKQKDRQGRNRNGKSWRDRGIGWELRLACDVPVPCSS